MKAQKGTERRTFWRSRSRYIKFTLDTGAEIEALGFNPDKLNQDNEAEAGREKYPLGPDSGSNPLKESSSKGLPLDSYSGLGWTNILGSDRPYFVTDLRPKNTKQDGRQLYGGGRVE